MTAKEIAILRKYLRQRVRDCKLYREESWKLADHSDEDFWEAFRWEGKRRAFIEVLSVLRKFK